jgi:hypothetical protein
MPEIRNVEDVNELIKLADELAKGEKPAELEAVKARVRAKIDARRGSESSRITAVPQAPAVEQRMKQARELKREEATSISRGAVASGRLRVEVDGKTRQLSRRLARAKDPDEVAQIKADLTALRESVEDNSLLSVVDVIERLRFVRLAIKKAESKGDEAALLDLRAEQRFLTAERSKYRGYSPPAGIR